MKRYALAVMVPAAVMFATAAISAPIATIQVDEAVPAAHRVEFIVTNDTGSVVEWFAVQTGNPMDYSSTADPDTTDTFQWDYDIILDYREPTWSSRLIRCSFCPIPPTSRGLDLDKTWLEVTGLTFGQFMAAGGFDPALGVLLALPVAVDDIAPTYAPAHGLPTGSSLGGFIVEGLPGSEFLAKLSTGELVGGPVGQPIVVGPGAGRVPEPGSAALLALGLAAVGSRRRARVRRAKRRESSIVSPELDA